MKIFWKSIAVLISVELLLQIVSYSLYLHSINVYTNTRVVTNWYTRLPSSAWWNAERNSLIPVYHPLLGFIFKNIHTPNIHIDSLGIRETTNNNPAATDMYKNIFLFGGSALTGYGVKDSETIPSYIAKELNTPTFRYKLFNFGQIRYNSNQELLFFILQLKKGIIPDLVIFYDGFNDAVLTLKTSPTDELNNIVGEQEYAKKIGSLSTLFLSDIENSSLIDVPTLQHIAESIIRRIKLIDYPIQCITWLTQKIHPSGHTKPPEVSEVKIQKTVDNYIANATMIHALSEQYHFKYILLWQPLPQNKKLTPEEKNETEIPYYPDNIAIIDSITTKLRTSNIKHFYDLSHSFNAYADTSIFMDSIHISPQGNEVVAEAISQLIESEMK